MTAFDARVVAHWAAQLGIESNALTEGESRVLCRNERPDRLLLFTVGPTQIYLLPPRFAGSVSSPPQFAQELDAWLGEPVKFLWRDFYYYAVEPGPAQPAPGPMRPLTADDGPALDSLKAACSPPELELAQITLLDPLLAGCFAGDILIGVASTLDVSPEIADIGVLTHPAWRGQGIASALTANLRNIVTTSGRVAQYTTMDTNHGSVRTAEKTGFALFLVESGYVLQNAAPNATTDH